MTWLREHIIVSSNNDWNKVNRRIPVEDED